MEDETADVVVPEIPDIDQREYKRAMLDSVACYIPREMGRDVFLRAGHLRLTFGTAAASLGVTEDLKDGHLVAVKVETIYRLCKGV